MTKTRLLADILTCMRTAPRHCAPIPFGRKQSKPGQTSRAVIVVLATMGAVFLSNCGGLKLGGKAEWKKYDIEDGNFAISLPTAPTTEKDSFRVAGQSIEMKIVSSENGSAAYVVAYCDFPGGNVFSDSPQELFDKVQAGMAKDFQGTITNTKRVSLDRFTGREIQISGSAGIHFVRLFFVRFRLFQVHAVVPTGDGANLDVSKFLNSFKLLRT